MRLASFAGSFYPYEKEEIIDFIQKNEKDISKLKEKIVASIVPHAGWVYSGKCALYTYKNLENFNIENIIIISTNHSSIGKVILSLEDVKTPLGKVKINKSLVKKFLELEFSEINEEIHAEEHSIEVQLPFLQYYLKDFSIVPILVSNLNVREIEELVKKLKEAYSNKTFFLFSGDFIHHGKIYGFEIFKENKKENVRNADMKFIECILNKDLRSFVLYAKKFYTICGYYSFQVFIEFSREMNLKNKLLCYYNSADITNDEEIIVGYASIAAIQS
ncbi:MAG: AmmeMemoRadiSam system protein B [Candidatus Aenigmatarchaeota archaeon]